MNCLVVIFINYSASLLRDRLKNLSFTTSSGHLNVKCPGFFFKWCPVQTRFTRGLYSEIVSGRIVFNTTLVGRRNVFVIKSNLGPSSMSCDVIATV